MNTRVEVPVSVVRELVARARFAPSTHNTQPWRWIVRVGDGREAVSEVELNRVDERALTAGDPTGRELVISCGAALLTLRVAAAQALLGTSVELLPDPDRPQVLARVQFVDGSVDGEFSRLDAAVPVRHTWRRGFSRRPVPPQLLQRLTTEAGAEGARLREVTAQERPVLAALVRECDIDYYRDTARRAEAARWLRPRWRGQGVPTPAVRLLPARLALRHTDIGVRLGVQRAGLLLSAPSVVVLWTDRDDAASWLAAGQALQRLLLVGAADGLAAGFVNRPCQDALRRGALRGLLALEGQPQVVLRLGFPEASARPVPRLPVEDVLAAPGLDGGQDGGLDGGQGPAWPAASGPGNSEDELG